MSLQSMKLSPRNLVRRRRVNIVSFLGVFLVLGAIVSISVVVASSKPSQDGANLSGKITQISQIIIEPMLVDVTGLSTTWIGGQPFLVVTMVATNNIGLVPTWRSEKVKLISVNFTMNYNSTSVAESINGVLVQPAIPTPMTFSANESKTFSVTVGPLPSGIGGTLVVQVNGWYSWFFAARGAEENPPIGITNGGGRFVPFSGTVTI